MLRRQVRAEARSRDEVYAEADRSRHEAVAICGDATDMLRAPGKMISPTWQRCRSGRGGSMRWSAALQPALQRYQRKGNLVSAGRVRARLAELRTHPRDEVLDAGGAELRRATLRDRRGRGVLR